jgi:ABC-type nitrate/sulfonate/bicarbonate transport system permease component
MVAGLVLAMPSALAYDAKVRTCRDESGVCWDRFYDQFIPVLGRMGIGVALGLALGLALCLLMPGLKRSRRNAATPR